MLPMGQSHPQKAGPKSSDTTNAMIIRMNDAAWTFCTYVPAVRTW
jgi:hypothetical protein